jgi:hypothetical protein
LGFRQPPQPRHTATTAVTRQTALHSRGTSEFSRWLILTNCLLPADYQQFLPIYKTSFH